MEELLNQVFEKMPRTFSSKEFGKGLRKKGLSKQMTQSGIMGKFLKKQNITRLGLKSWSKEPLNLEAKIEFPEPEMDLKKCIEFIKSKGFKVMKAEYVEV